MNLANMKVSTKLYLGFSVPVILMLTLVTVNIWEMKQINGNLERIVLVNNVRGDLVNDAAQKVREMSTGIREIFLVKEDQNRERIKKEITDNRAKYAGDFKKIEETTNESDTKGKELIVKLKAATDAARESNNQAIALAMAHKDDEGIAFVGTTAGPAVARMMVAMDQLIDHQRSRSMMRYEESKQSYASARLFMLSLVGTATLLAALISFFITRSITGPLNRVIAGLTEGANQVSSAAGQVSSSSQSLAEGTSEQAASLEETSSSLEEMSSMTKQNADNTNQAKAMMSEANKIVEKVEQHMRDMANAVSEITRSSEETGKIVKTIDEIAFQTNLLALNAAVEAARAGEAGAGFAVVADEVRNLALRASEAAKNTSNLIENTIKAVRNGNDLTTATQVAFKENAEISIKIAQLVDEIATASEEQSKGISQVNLAVSEMDKVTQSTAADAEESAAASEELNAQAEQMKGFVEDLVKIVGGSVHSGSSVSGLNFRHERTAATPARVALSVPSKKALGKGALNTMRKTSPKDLIDMNGGSFKDF